MIYKIAATISLRSLGQACFTWNTAVRRHYRAEPEWGFNCYTRGMILKTAHQREQQ